MKIEKIFLAVALSVLAAAVIMLLAGIMKKNYEPNQYKDAAVITAARDIPEGKLLTQGDLDTKKVFLSEPNAIAVPDGKTGETANKYVTKTAIPKGNQITLDMIAEKGKGPVYAEIQAGKRVYVAPEGVAAAGAARVRDFNTGGRNYALWSVTPEQAQEMLLMEVKAK